MSLPSHAVLHTPPLTHWQSADELHFALDAEGPNWLATDARGSRVLQLVDGRRTLGEVARLAEVSFDPVKAYQQVMDFIEAASRAGLVATEPFERRPYAGRAEHLREWTLRELWFHTNDSCNLQCGHCLVSSGPEGSGGLATEVLRDVIDQAVALGVERVFFTGGEPFLRKDLFSLIEHVTVHHGRELVILTNATLLERHRDALASLDRARVRFQVSLDGVTAAVNDPLRGRGSFDKATQGLRLLSSLGFETSLTAVPCKANLGTLAELPGLAKALGATSFHLMWPHRRGRALSRLDDVPSVEALLELTRATRDAAQAVGIKFDNLESVRLRANSVAGVKHDLGMAGVESLCLSSVGSCTPRRPPRTSPSSPWGGSTARTRSSR